MIHKKIFLLTCLAGLLAISNIWAQPLKQKEVLGTMTKVNAYFMKKYADYRMPSFQKKVRPSNIWTRTVYYEGLLAMYSIYPLEEYYEYALGWANFHEWGFHRGTTTRHADNYSPGQIYLDLYNICPNDAEKIRKTRANIDMLTNTPQVNEWWWIDAIQMGGPIFAKMGHLTGEQKYFDKLWAMYEYTRNEHGDNGMFNPKDGLWWRDQDFDPPYKEPNGANCYWSRGNGWVYAALASWMKSRLTKNTVPTI